MSFLEKDYEVPTSEGGKYMKFEQGDNVFRVLGDPILGWEGWVPTSEGSDEPKRFEFNEKPTDASKFRDGRLKHFWAMPVWNYNAEKVQILQITQSTIQKAIKGFYADEDWGDPKDYDIKVHRTGEKLETEYSVSPKPHKDLDPKIAQEYENTSINLEALFDGGDPFEMNVDDKGKPDTGDEDYDDITADDLPDF